MKNRFKIIFVTVAFLTIITHSNLWAEIPTEMEPDYSEAVLSYNSKNYDRALAVLNTLLSKSPNTIEFMELKALTLKGSHRPEQSEEVYLQLIKEKNLPSIMFMQYARPYSSSLVPKALLVSIGMMALFWTVFIILLYWKMKYSVYLSLFAKI